MAPEKRMDNMARGAGIRQWLLSRLPLVAVAAVLLSALLLVAGVQQETSSLNQFSLWIFALTALALLALLIAIINQGIQLVRKVRRREPGARMSRRLILILFGLALPPVLIVYFFSLEFLDETVDGWFDVGTGEALQQSLEIGQMFLDTRVLEAQEATRDMALDIALLEQSDWFDALLNRVSTRGPIELAVLSANGDTITSVNIRSATLVADLPDNFTLIQAAESGSYTAAEPVDEDGLQIRALEQLPQRQAGQPTLFLQAIYPLPEAFSARASQVESAFYRYQTANYLRQQLKRSFILILSLVLVLTLLLAMLLGFGVSRRLVRPLTQLTAATRDIAAGDFERRVSISGEDELAFLAQSFNRMAEDLTTGRDALEAERRNLEILLTRLSAGVLAIDGEGRLSLSNDSAATILAAPLGYFNQQPLAQLSAEHPNLKPLIDVIENHLGPAHEWREEVRLQPHQGKPLALVCRGAPLPGIGGGHVVVFDDVTVLTEAQREAAWAEVARRLAHEVKNPLTPIRLAAERMAMKLTPALAEKEQALLEKTTRTIITQVEALRAMVNAFGDYAQATRVERRQHDVCTLIKSVAALYESGGELSLNLQLSSGRAMVEGDEVKLRQTLLNLLKNAQEAGASEVTIHTSAAPDSGTSDTRSNELQLLLLDNGPGFPEQTIDRMFEPYISGKPKGDGLGLAICRRIIEEHGGSIKASNQKQGGGCITIRLPLSSGVKNNDPITTPSKHS